jgi:hypothetical protein
MTERTEQYSGQNGERDVKQDYGDLNLICMQCGQYGSSTCAVCPVELYRQQMVLSEMKRREAAVGSVCGQDRRESPVAGKKRA